MTMKSYPDLSEPGTAALRRALDVVPAAALRDRVLAGHARRRRQRAVATAAAVAVVFSVFFGLHAGYSPQPDEASWQARSAALEASWRQRGDSRWLADDARARPLLQRLRRVDTRLDELLASGSDARSAAMAQQLWRERSETLSALIDTHRQGGVAIRL